MNAKIAIIGAGKMGTAMHDALISVFSPDAVLLCDRSTDFVVLAQYDVIIFAVKPQDFEACIKGITADLSKKIILSIMAGVSLEKLSAQTGAAKVVRVMPNMALQARTSFTPWVGSSTVIEKALIQKILSSFGAEMELMAESQIDAVTPLSGCGPAYFFYLCELLQQKAVKVGFTEEQGRLIAEQTFTGAAKVLTDKKMSAADLRSAVTSKGGSTEAAFQSFANDHFAEIFEKGLDAAFNRWR